MAVSRNKKGELMFTDYPEFKPNLSPKEIFLRGSFGGTYWRNIHSTVVNKDLSNVHKKYPKEWWEGIPTDHMTRSWNNYDKSINKYGVKVGSTLEEWEGAGWITHYHPYGWVHWYCDFCLGKRCPDDIRQIKRWERVAGKNGRFRKRLENMIKNGKDSLAIRQTLQHWAWAQ